MLLSQEPKGKGKGKVPVPVSSEPGTGRLSDAGHSLKGGRFLHGHCWATCQLLKLRSEGKTSIGADI